MFSRLCARDACRDSLVSSVPSLPTALSYNFLNAHPQRVVSCRFRVPLRPSWTISLSVSTCTRTSLAGYTWLLRSHKSCFTQYSSRYCSDKLNYNNCPPFTMYVKPLIPCMAADACSQTSQARGRWSHTVRKTHTSSKQSKRH